MDADQLISESWRAKLTEWRQRPDSFAFASAPEFKALRQFRTQGEHGLLAALYEALGTTDLLLAKAQPGMVPLTRLGSLGYLVLAAYWYRVAGDGERSTLTGKRALLELRHFLAEMDVGRFELPVPHVRWYVLEMAGDAAVCCDRAEAVRLYQAAAEGFRNVRRLDQMSDAQDPFPGEYLSAMAELPLPGGTPAELREEGEERIAYKVRHWVGE